VRLSTLFRLLSTRETSSRVLLSNISSKSQKYGGRAKTETG
jgi:hypothetical protein